jgi:hypothetical protein
MITDTTSFCTVAEADTYLSESVDHPNRLFCSEWLSATVAGTKAALSITGLGGYGTPPTDYSGYTITAVSEGDAGNALQWSVTAGGGGSNTISVAGNLIGIIAQSGCTLDDVADLIESYAPAAALVVMTYSDPDASLVYRSQGAAYLSGGVDPDADRQGYKAPALAMATRKINALSFKGRKAVATQANAFPRTYTYDNVETTETETPEAIKQATCEEALAILKYGNSDRHKLQMDHVSKYQLGYTGLIEEFKGISTGLISPEAIALLRPYMRRAVRIS